MSNEPYYVGRHDDFLQVKALGIYKDPRVDPFCGSLTKKSGHTVHGCERLENLMILWSR